MMNNYYPYQPYTCTPQSLIRVTGIDGAKAYQMAPNSTAALFDNNEDYFYVKTTDGAGFPTIRTFKFEEMSDFDKKPDFNTDFVSKNEFETFKQEVVDYVQQFIQQNPKSAKQDFTANANGKQHKTEQS